MSLSLISHHILKLVVSLIIVVGINVCKLLSFIMFCNPHWCHVINERYTDGQTNRQFLVLIIFNFKVFLGIPESSHILLTVRFQCNFSMNMHTERVLHGCDAQKITQSNNYLNRFT